MNRQCEAWMLTAHDPKTGMATWPVGAVAIVDGEVRVILVGGDETALWRSRLDAADPGFRDGTADPDQIRMLLGQTNGLTLAAFDVEVDSRMQTISAFDLAVEVMWDVAVGRKEQPA